MTGGPATVVPAPGLSTLGRRWPEPVEGERRLPGPGHPA